MGEHLIKPYEISVWEDKLIQDGNEKKFIENRLAVIGSNTMTGLNKVYEPIFNKKSNGERTLTFSLKYKYFDPYIGEEVVNPFASLLINERKVKLHYDNNWYEFIIKDHTESSDGYEWTYTCTDAFVLELSKIGYNITFDTELNNNQGTALELTKETIKNTDWRVKEVNTGRQLVSEPIYKGTIVNSFSALNTDTNKEEVCSGEVYVFYSYIKNKDGKYLQFIKQAESYTIDDKNTITATNYRIKNDVIVTDTEIKTDDTVLIRLGEVETKYQANRLVYKQRTTYDPVMGRTVDRFKAGDREIYRYVDSIYSTSDVLINYVTNGENFNILEDGSLQGWNPYVGNYEQSEGSSIKKLELVTNPELGANKPLAALSSLAEIEGYLKVQFNGSITQNYNNTIYNSGFENNSSSIESVAKGQKFVLRWRAKKDSVDSTTPAEGLRALVAKYSQDDPTPYKYYFKHIDPDNIVLRFDGSPKILNNIVEGGYIDWSNNSYYIDNVAQTVSTKYIYKDSHNNNQQYVWSGAEKKFVELDEENYSNYLPYYYLVSEATKTVPNSVLSDPSQRYGIFFYNIEGEVTYFIQDVQLTRFIADGDNKEVPILIGNVPTATAKESEYYYLKPSKNAIKEDIKTYATLDSLKTEFNIQETITPIYNEESEKVLSISAAQSNCFNILQTIAETFECWVELEVEHDEIGRIEYDEDGLPKKYINLREYIGNDNWAGFKYGINLQSIERNINSEEFVTKMIVDASQSDYVDEGLVSIANAKSNPSGESYILNFDYYYNQGLLDREDVEAEKTSYINQLSSINTEIKELEIDKLNYENSFTKLSSDRNVYTEMVETAKNNQSLALEDFQSLTGLQYEDYQKRQAEAIIYDNKYFVKTRDTEVIEGKKYYTRENDIFNPVDNPTQSGLSTYYEILLDFVEEDNLVDILGEVYVNSATINNYGGFVTNIEREYQEVKTTLYGLDDYSVKIWTDRDNLNIRHVYVELNDYLPGFKFQIEGSPYTSTVSQKFFDKKTENATEINFMGLSDYKFVVDGSEQESFTYEINDNVTANFKFKSNNTVEGIVDKIDKLIEQKAQLIKEFEGKYSRFIQEGTWNSTDYIDADLYYLDALQVSNTSAQPVVSYTINVVEVSQLENLSDYLFDAGDKTYIEDTEFFGWNFKNIGTEDEPNYIQTPAREEVIVSEVEWHLDEPDKNTITVQNYKTRFEDLFQRISATVQTVQYNEATYAKISTLLDADGTINQNVLLDSLNNASGRQYSLTTDGSVEINGDEISIHNLTNPANYVKINTEGIKVSSDGGNTWKPVIDGQGINIGAVYTGSLNTNEVIIGNKENPSFRWDKSGISAYKSKEDETYDLQTYVRYDQYGLYGIKDGETFKAQNLQDVLDKAHFAVTWDGFFIKNSYEDGGRVSITSDDDFQVIDGTHTERIKIGSLGLDEQTGERIYGINISDKNGNSILNTDNDGNLTVTGTINAQAGEFSGLVQVGTGEPHINIDGVNSLISTSNYQTGSGWMINADGDAVFNNITARGAIKTAVFEYAEIQAVGGIFIFRPSSTIRSVELGPEKQDPEETRDLILTVEKPQLFKVGQWCKVSNYYNGNNNPDVVDPQTQTILQNNGLAHVYEITNITTTGGKTFITLDHAAAMVESESAVVESINDLIGGALVDMGNEDGTSNYGIGINSSDNTVALPARAISLFETSIDETKEAKVSYNYQGILGTLPELPATSVNTNIYNNMIGTQGIYTDNMYLGDLQQYLAFYTDKETGERKLRISAAEISFEIPDEHGQGSGQYQNVADIEAEGTPGPPGEDAISTYIDSSAGTVFVNGVISTILRCYVYKGGVDITNDDNYIKTYTWVKINAEDGSIIQDWTPTAIPLEPNAIRITADDVTYKAIFQCSVDVEEA